MKKDIETLIAEERAEIITKYDKVCAWKETASLRRCYLSKLKNFTLTYVYI